MSHQRESRHSGDGIDVMATRHECAKSLVIVSPMQPPAIIRMRACILGMRISCDLVNVYTKPLNVY